MKNVSLGTSGCPCYHCYTMYAKITEFLCLHVGGGGAGGGAAGGGAGGGGGGGGLHATTNM